MSLSSERIYTGRVVNLRLDEIPRPRHAGARRVEVVEHVGGVCVIARPTPHEIVLVKQYRHAVGCELWEVPAGMIDRGEEPIETARRELIEETGFRADSLRYVWSMFSTPGFCEERIYFFAAEGLTPGDAQPEDDEEFELRIWPIEEAWALVESDELRDAKTQIALGWALREAARLTGQA